jgi:hypothetical protein
MAYIHYLRFKYNLCPATSQLYLAVTAGLHWLTGGQTHHIDVMLHYNKANLKQEQ